MSIGSKIEQLKQELPPNVKLIAVSKFHPVDVILEAYRAGQRVFGENRAQELVAKQKLLPSDIEWHFIGSLQTNKVKDIVPFVSTIQSVDSLKLLQEIDKQAAKQNRILPVLLEIHIAMEGTKHGFMPSEVKDLLEKENIIDKYVNIRVCGLMGMATLTDDKTQVRKEFRSLHTLFDELKSSTFTDVAYFKELSMGMTDDYPVAVEEGSTMVRIGSYIFGPSTILM